VFAIYRDEKVRPCTLYQENGDSSAILYREIDGLKIRGSKGRQYAARNFKSNGNIHYYEDKFMLKMVEKIELKSMDSIAIKGFSSVEEETEKVVMFLISQEKALDKNYIPSAGDIIATSILLSDAGKLEIQEDMCTCVCVCAFVHVCVCVRVCVCIRVHVRVLC
jgi:hypothetical protein